MRTNAGRDWDAVPVKAVLTIRSAVTRVEYHTRGDGHLYYQPFVRAPLPAFRAEMIAECAGIGESVDSDVWMQARPLKRRPDAKPPE